MTTEEEDKTKEEKKLGRSKLLKVSIRIRSQDGKLDEEFDDYVLEVDKDRVYVKTENPWPVGTVVHLGMDLPGVEKTIHFKGEVVRINPHKPTTPDGLEPGMGIVFERVSYDNRRLINEYLDKVASEERSEEYSMFLAWVNKVSRPMTSRERERIKKDLLKALYSAGKEREPIPLARRKKTAHEMELISKVPLFEELDDIELEEVARVMAREEFKGASVIFEEGDVGDKMYIIIRGSVDIVKATGQGPGQILVTLHMGDYFGEMSLIDEAPRSAAARAADDCTLFSIHKKDLALLLDNSPTIAAKIYKFFVMTLNQRLRETNEKIKAFLSMAQEISQS